MKIGIISDTHSLLRPEVSSVLSGTDAILHAGDIGNRQILNQLQSIAPVHAVQGNADTGWAEDLPSFLDFELAGLRFYITHKKKDLPKDLSLYDLVVVGHSHQYAEKWLPPVQGNRTLLFNPGSCGPRRFYQPITIAIMIINDDGWIVERVDIAHPVRRPKIDPDNIRAQVEIVGKELSRGRGPKEISEKYGMDPALAEQIVRLYVTHPGVTVDGVMTKMGL